MKKIFSIVLVLTLMVASLVGCGGSSKHFSGEWKFSKINKVEFVPELDDGVLDLLKQEYNVADEAGIISNAFDKFTADETFASVYLKFGGKHTYTYDPLMEREATWVFYQTSENGGFISFYSELDVNDGNPDPVVCPEVSYDADTNIMYITINAYGAFMVTLELTR
jgi:hypothetical protein